MAQVHVSLQGCLIAAMIMFTGTSVHPLLTLIVTMEISIFCFFFVVYTLAIQRYLPFILWPVSVSEGQWGGAGGPRVFKSILCFFIPSGMTAIFSLGIVPEE